MRNFVLPLNSAQATLLSAGGKGVNLSELIRAGFSVPPGFIISTIAYSAFVTANELEEPIAELSLSAHTDDAAVLETASQSIRNLFQEALMPGNIMQDIIGRYQQLMELVLSQKSESQNCFPPSTLAQDLNLLSVAVRSSATVEDLPEVSFAGLHDTYLNVQGEGALLEAVIRCWSSLWTARAMSFRKHHGIDSAVINQAVVVQQMVCADKSGILFTVNPTTGNRNEAVINAVWGLGESVVGGRVTPDTVAVEKATGIVNHMDVANKEVMTVPADQGTTEIPIESQQRLQPVLSKDETEELTRLGSSIETHFYAPQDVEYAIVNKKVYILQSRPITEMPSIRMVPKAQPLFSAVVPGDDDWPILGKWSSQPFDEWTRANVGELWREPVSPLVSSTVPMIISGAVHHSFQGVNAEVLDQVQWAKRFYGRIYYNEGALRYLISKELGLPATIMDKTRGNIRGRNRIRDSKFRPLRILRHLPVLRRLAMRQWSTGQELDTLIPKIDQWVADFLNQSSFEQSDRELWDEALTWLERIKHALKLQNDMSGYSQTALAMLERMTVRWFGRRDLALDMVTGLPGIQSAEIKASLWQMAQTINDLGLTKVIVDNDSKTALSKLRQAAEAEPVIKMLDSFLREHGYRCPNEAEWLHPRWIDEPEQIIELVTCYMGPGYHLDLADAGTRQRREEAVAWVEARLGLLRRAIFRFVLHRTQHAVRLRDNGKSHAIKASYPARKISALFGVRWTSRGWLKQAEDFFFLTVPDVQKIIDAGDPVAAGFHLHTLVAERRKAFEYWFRVDAPNELGADGQPIVIQPMDESSELTLQGISASSGRVQGTARIIHDPHEALKMQPEEILVTRAADSGWSAVFPLIAGLVTEIGGQLSHAAILAREYGLPAIVNVPHATSRIRDGQTIIIDCTTGCVYKKDVGININTPV